MERESEQTLIEPFSGPAPGTVLLEKYRVDWMLGMGGFGLVLRAQNLALDEACAIKILRDDAEDDHENVERFLREARAVVRLKSEHVTRIKDVGLLPSGAPYMVMELLEGEDLGKVVAAATRLAPTRAVDYLLHACDALAEAHSIGIVHRDIKPTNLFVAKRNDGSSVVKVLDFGISKAVTTVQNMSLTQSASVLGTPAYMSPEQMRSARNVDVRTDIWSLGCVLYELVEGVLPFMAENFAELCVVVATEPPRQMANVPRELERVITRCLAKQPADRYQSVGDLAMALAPFATPAIASAYVPRIQRVLMIAEATAAAASSPLDAATIRGAGARNRPKWIALGLVGVAAVTLAVVLATGGSSDAPAKPPQPAATATTPAAVDAGNATPPAASPAATAPAAAKPLPAPAAAQAAQTPVQTVGSRRPNVARGSGAGSAARQKPVTPAAPPTTPQTTGTKPKCDPFKSVKAC